MNEREQALAKLREVFDGWEQLLSGLSEAEITTARGTDMSIRDVIAHVAGWQQLSVERLSAALEHRDPVSPSWSLAANPDDGDHDATNARIQAQADGKSWSDVHREWRTQFQHFLELGEAVPDEDLLTVGQFPWFYDEYALVGVLQGSYEHHQEHLEPFVADEASPQR